MFRHPEGKIQLLDGRVLDCYPLEDSMNPQRVLNVDDEEEKELLRLFLDNAFVLLANRERILSDSRMFLCPLPFCRNGLAYTGTSGFQRPTLGIYLEFWMTCDQACLVDDNDGKWLLHHIAGIYVCPELAVNGSISVHHRSIFPQRDSIQCCHPVSHQVQARPLCRFRRNVVSSGAGYPGG